MTEKKLVKPKNKTAFKQITIAPYHVELWILITDNPNFECAKMNQKHKGLNLVWPSDASAFTQGELYKGYILTVVFDGSFRELIDIITHETIHIKNVVMKHSGMDPDLDNDEAEAYLSGWIALRIHQVWKEYKRL